MAYLKMPVWISFLLFFAAGIISCKNNTTPKQQAFIDFSGMDSSVKAGDDFFSYANGKWFKETTIPSDQAAWGAAYILYDENRKKLHNLLEEAAAAKDLVKGSSEQMMGDLYAAAMDSAAIDKAGYTPVTEDLKRIDGLSGINDIIKECAYEYTRGDGNLFGASVGPDERNASVNRLQFAQSGLSLPSRDYYLNNDSAGKHIRNEFTKYVTGIFKAAGNDSIAAATAATQILQLETELAKSHSTPVELRDPIKNYNKFAVTDLNKLTPGINWTEFITAIGAHTDTVLVGQPAYFKALNTQLKLLPVDAWKNKLKLKVIEDASLGNPFEDLQFGFYRKTLRGIQEKGARWKRVTRVVDNLAGDILGQVYVKKYFPEEAKKRMLDLVNNLQLVYEKRIKNLDWMDDSTKQKALHKLNAFIKKIGYPDKWKDYAGVTIARGDHFGNIRQLKVYDFKKDLAKIDKPVDKTEWFMNASEVNAYYNPSFNEIVFPAGILQPPFFNNAADDAINYGAAGAIIGHEMTHGFDDQGRQYDADGNLNDWWTKKDAEQFMRKAKVVIDQYNSYKMFDTLHVNGELTLGENIADIGGLMIAYEAFKNTAQGKSNEKIDGLTPDQRFFLSFGTVWREKNTEASAREFLLVDPHSPEKYRANGPTSSMPEFYQAFNIKPGDKMYRADSVRASIW